MEEKKELYHCQKCKSEFWLSLKESLKKGSLCPNHCERNFAVCLGETEDEIKRKREYFLKDVFDFEMPEEEEEEFQGGSSSRKGSGKYEYGDIEE